MTETTLYRVFIRSHWFEKLVLLLSIAVISASIGCGGNETRPDSTVTFTPAGASTPPAEASVAATPAATTPVSVVKVTGLFQGPPTSVQPSTTTRTLGARPVSQFPPLDGRRTVIYDTKESRTIDLGEGGLAVFSPDSSWAGWLTGPGAGASGTANMIQLETGERRAFGTGTQVAFLDDSRFVVFHGAISTLYDLNTGRKSADQMLPPGYDANPILRAPAGQAWQVSVDPASALPRGGAGKSHFRLVNSATKALLLEFDAVEAALALWPEIVIATPVEGINTDVQNTMTNIFVVNIQTGVAQFITRTRYGPGPNWPLSATSKYVLWTDGFCSQEQGYMQLYDRESKTLIDIEDNLGPQSQNGESLRYGTLTPAGLIAQGSFGADALIDPDSMTYTSVLPRLTGELYASGQRWSPDFRYATHILGGGHGGLC